jgi:hypothetical protein
VTRTRRGGYEFVRWVGDYDPAHVHVYRDGVLVLKWNLELEVAMQGHATRRVVSLIRELRLEGRL